MAPRSYIIQKINLNGWPETSRRTLGCSALRSHTCHAILCGIDNDNEVGSARSGRSKLMILSIVWRISIARTRLPLRRCLFSQQTFFPCLIRLSDRPGVYDCPPIDIIRCNFYVALRMNQVIASDARSLEFTLRGRAVDLIEINRFSFIDPSSVFYRVRIL